MDLRTFKILVAVGMLLYGSLYLTAVFVAAILTRNGPAEWMALFAAGATYLCFHAGWVEYRTMSILSNMLGVFGGVIAGLWLMVH